MRTFPGFLKAAVVLLNPVVFKSSRIVPLQYTSDGSPAGWRCSRSPLQTVHWD
jgi:hypothetical protein